MQVKKKFTLIILMAAGVVLIYALSFGLKYAYIGSSYDAKTVCSCMFISHRALENIKKEDLYAIPFAHIAVDQDHKSVTADIYGMAKTKAIFRPGLGCTLVNELSEDEIRQQPAFINSDSVTDSIEKAPSLTPFVDSAQLYHIIENAFLETDTTKIKRTRAVVILHQGKLIAERYALTISPSTPLLGWSMTKSVTNAMIGLLVKDSLLHTDQTALLEEWIHDDRKNITLDNLLRMSSGLQFKEDYTTPSDATTMLFRTKGAGAFAAHSKLSSPPGSTWSYSSGTTNILQEIIRRKFNTLAEYQAFPHQRLFNKIGMHSAIVEPDASGTYVGSSFMFATARDWAKFGQLYLQDGIWNGDRILPEGWVAYSAKETPHSNGRYAAQFWLNHTDPAFPQDAFMADGFEGQFVVIVPSKQLVIVRLGCSQHEGFDINPFVKDICKTIK